MNHKTVPPLYNCINDNDLILYWEWELVIDVLIKLYHKIMLKYLMKITKNIGTLNKSDDTFNKLKIKLPRFLVFEVTIEFQNLALSTILFLLLPNFSVTLNNPLLKSNWISVRGIYALSSLERTVILWGWEQGFNIYIDVISQNYPGCFLYCV